MDRGALEAEVGWPAPLVPWSHSLQAGSCLWQKAVDRAAESFPATPALELLADASGMPQQSSNGGVPKTTKCQIQWGRVLACLEQAARCPPEVGWHPGG